MTSKGKVWSYGVAYISLAVGAGVSVAGNVADTHRIAADSGRTPDGLDIFIAGFWPAAVLLVIEMFVSRLWPRTFGAQAIRWTASITFGFIAAYMSWIHLSDLLLSRAQPETVATLGPLAIDGLAIMATALILAARGHKVDNGPGFMATVDTAMDRFLAKPDVPAARPLPPFDEQAPADTDESVWESLVDRLGGQEPTLPAPVSPAPVGTPTVDKVPATARDMIQTWMDTPVSERPSVTDMATLVGAAHGRSSKTVRRWRDAMVAG